MTEAVNDKPAAVDFSRSGVARYIQLAMLFRRRIESGQWLLGQQIPTVDELAEECSVARATVRQALDSLEDEKLIERFRAKGTFVTQRPQNKLWCEVPTDWSGLLMAPEGVSIKLLNFKKGVMPRTLQHPIGELAPAYWYWHRLHSRNEQPYYLGHAYIDERIARRIPKNAFRTQTTMRVLKDVPGLTMGEVHQTITIGTADIDLSTILNIPLNAPVAHVYRTATDGDGTVIFVGVGAYRGDVVRLDIKVSP